MFMKATEYIKILKNMVDQHGDLDCVYHVGYEELELPLPELMDDLEPGAFLILDAGWLAAYNLPVS